MGKKKKGKLSKGDISVVSRGFDNMGNDEREDLVAFFDKMKDSMERGEDVSEIVEAINTTGNDEEPADTELTSEIDAFIFGDKEDNNDENEAVYSSTLESANLPIKEEIKADVNIEHNVTVVNVENIDKSNDEDFDNSPDRDCEIEDVDDEYVPPMNYGLIMENDNELLTATSCFKSAQTIDLYRMRKSAAPSSKHFDDETKSIIIMNIKTLVKGMIYPEFMMEYDKFVDKFIRIGAPIPENVYVRTAIGPDGKRYAGLFMLEMEELDEALDDMCEYIDSTGSNFLQIVIHLIQAISSITFKEDDVERYFTQNRILMNREFGDLFIEYCVNRGKSILVMEDEAGDENLFFTRMNERGLNINQAIVREAAESIKNILIVDEDEDIHEPDDFDEEVPSEDEDTNCESDYTYEYNNEEESSVDEEIEIEDYDSHESMSVGANVIADAIRNSNYSATVSSDDSESDSSWIYTPKEKEKRR